MLSFEQKRGREAKQGCWVLLPQHAGLVGRKDKRPFSRLTSCFVIAFVASRVKGARSHNKSSRVQLELVATIRLLSCSLTCIVRCVSWFVVCKSCGTGCSKGRGRRASSFSPRAISESTVFWHPKNNRTSKSPVYTPFYLKS